MPSFIDVGPAVWEAWDFDNVDIEGKSYLGASAIKCHSESK